MMQRRWGMAVRMVAVGLVAVAVGTSVDAARGSAQVPSAPVPNPPTRVGAEAVVAARGAPPRPLDGSPYAALPPAGGNVVDAASSTSIPGVGIVELPGVAACGGPTGGTGSSATTTVSAWRVELFGGRVRAGDIRVTAKASLADGQASVDGDASFEGLVVDGVPYPAARPGQQIPLPGIGTLIVRERTVVQFGPASATVTVRAMRIVPSGNTVAGVPADGEVVIGAASDGVPDFALSPPDVLTSDVVATPDSYVAISTRAPIDLSVRDTIVGNDNFEIDNDNFEIDNGNGNSNGGTSATPGSTRTVTTGTSAPIVVTVVIVVQTPSPSSLP